MSLNSTFSTDNACFTTRELMIFRGAGPVFTMLQAIAAYLLIKWSRNNVFYPALFTAFYMRLLAGAMNVINPNDEGVISRIMGMGTYSLSFIITGALFCLLYKTAKTERYPLRFSMITLDLTLLFSSILIISDLLLHIRIL